MNIDTLLKHLNMLLTKAGWFNAINSGDLDLIKIFIDNKFDINVTNNIGNTALVNEVKNNKINTVKLLLDAGADVNAKHVNSADTALDWAVEFNNTNIVKLLLKAGANVNHQNNTGFTPLILSIKQKDITIAKILLEAGADTNIKTVIGNTARIIAKERGYYNIIELLNTHEKECSNTSKEYSSIMFSVKTSDLDDIIESAIDAGAKSNFKIYDSDTALIIAKHFKQSIIKN